MNFSLNLNLKQIFDHFLTRFTQDISDPEQRFFYIIIAMSAFVMQFKALIFTFFIAGFYFELKQRYGHLEGASLGELVLVFIPASLLYLTTCFCLTYGYIHARHHLLINMGFLQIALLMILFFIPWFFIASNKRHRNLLLLDSLILDSIISLLYLTILFCFTYGYIHTLHIPTGMGFLYGHGNWAALNFDLIFRNSQAVVGLCSKQHLIDVTLGEIFKIIVPAVAFTMSQRLLVVHSGRALIKKLWTSKTK